MSDLERSIDYAPSLSGNFVFLVQVASSLLAKLRWSVMFDPNGELVDPLTSGGHNRHRRGRSEYGASCPTLTCSDMSDNCGDLSFGSTLGLFSALKMSRQHRVSLVNFFELLTQRSSTMGYVRVRNPQEPNCDVRA